MLGIWDDHKPSTMLLTMAQMLYGARNMLKYGLNQIWWSKYVEIWTITIYNINSYIISTTNGGSVEIRLKQL